MAAWDAETAQTYAQNINGIILSGGPESVTSEDTPHIPDYIFDASVPILGICYGMQALTKKLGGEVNEASEREFGFAQVSVVQSNDLFSDLYDSKNQQGQLCLDVWMSHEAF